MFPLTQIQRRARGFGRNLPSHVRLFHCSPRQLCLWDAVLYPSEPVVTDEIREAKKHTLRPWVASPIVDLAEVKLPSGRYCHFQPFSKNFALIWQSAGTFADEIKSIEPKYLIYNFDDNSYTEHHLFIPAEFYDSLWLGAAASYPYFCVGSAKLGLIFDFSESMENPRFVQKFSHTGNLYDDFEMVVDKLRNGEEAEKDEIEIEDMDEMGNIEDMTEVGAGKNTKAEKKQDETDSIRCTQEEEEDTEIPDNERMVAKYKLYGKEFMITLDDKTWSQAIFTVIDGDQRLIIPGPHVNHGPPLAYDSELMLVPKKSGEEAFYNFSLMNWHTGEEVREIEFPSAPQSIEAGWDRYYFWNSSSLWWLDTDWEETSYLRAIGPAATPKPEHE
eukprot:TRINITY_DN7172_c0_g1_i1.p1 TRINITY_DN7172_c0_g1~~TRINITY_DN7172_c0_g1_i1.p1  ORF type:complete len:387 (+),score=76.45 TRINITY_DN7172_c0_g1_i1:80-1240(+)